MSEIENTLRERGERYGKFSGHANIAQRLKDEMRLSRNWDSADCMEMRDSMREALDMIQHKIARILNGDPTYADSWHDIVGYAKLVEDELNGVDSNDNTNATASSTSTAEQKAEYPCLTAEEFASIKRDRIFGYNYTPKSCDAHVSLPTKFIVDLTT